MPNKNFDGIKKINIVHTAKVTVVTKRRILRVDGLVRRTVVQSVVQKPKIKAAAIARFRPFVAAQKTDWTIFFKNLYTQQRVPVLAAVLALFLAFGGGAWFALNTSRSAADDQPQVLAAQTQTPAGSVVLPGLAVPNPGDAQASNVLFNTPLESLKNYFDSINQPDVINTRKLLLEQFLKDMHSPLVPAAATIANQPHWQLILAIAFAESTLGKNCADFNCSNIGVGPSSPYWHKYDSYDAWVVDFNRLLDKKYSDWTLKEMCGVYVKPCNPNWLAATQEILDALKDRGIE